MGWIMPDVGGRGAARSGVSDQMVDFLGMTASEVVLPADVAELAAILQQANAEGRGVCITGGGTKLQWGNRPARFDLLVGTRSLDSTCEIDADDLTATMSAGVTVAKAGTQARAKGRVLPLDASLPGFSTIGGVGATGDQGIRGAGYGRVRDLVLGLEAVLADGTTVRFGGRTMKNVAGYDMSKLFIGSFGTLGVITEITFRLIPQSDTQGLMILPFTAIEEAQRIVSAILDSPLQPLVLAAVSPDVFTANDAPRLPDSSAGPKALGLMVSSAAGAEGILLAGFAGHEAAVARSLSDVSAWAKDGAPAVLRDEEAEAVLDAVAGLGGSGLALRACVPMHRVWGLLDSARESATAAGLPFSYRVDGAWGMLDLWLRPPPDGEVESAALAQGPFVAGLRAEAERAGGWLVVTAGAALLPAGSDAWGTVGPSLRLMAGLKERFDPRHTLNPGRFVGGI